MKAFYRLSSLKRDPNIPDSDQVKIPSANLITLPPEDLAIDPIIRWVEMIRIGMIIKSIGGILLMIIKKLQRKNMFFNNAVIGKGVSGINNQAGLVGNFLIRVKLMVGNHQNAISFSHALH